jgi:hypothetical protein
MTTGIPSGKWGCSLLPLEMEGVLSLRVYLDNVAASGRVLGDLAPVAEMDAVRSLWAAHEAGTVKLVTSRQSWREQERTADPVKRAMLEEARDELSAVVADHTVLGFHGVSPLVTDIVDPALYADLRAVGLHDSDAKHLMYAVTNACDRFVTLDSDFLDRREALEIRCPSIRIVRPSELAAELR